VKVQHARRKQERPRYRASHFMPRLSRLKLLRRQRKRNELQCSTPPLHIHVFDFFPPPLTPIRQKVLYRRQDLTALSTLVVVEDINIRGLAYSTGFAILADILQNRINNSTTSLVYAMTQFTTICHSTSYSSQKNHTHSRSHHPKIAIHRCTSYSSHDRHPPVHCLPIHHSILSSSIPFPCSPPSTSTHHAHHPPHPRPQPAAPSQRAVTETHASSRIRSVRSPHA
jgi:hypothetical protein